MLINRENLASLFRGYQSVFQSAFVSGSPLWNQVATLINSTTASETYGWLGQTTGFREWLGDRVIQNLALHDYSIKNKSFENTVGVKREEIEDDTYGVHKPVFAQLGQDAALHPDQLVFELLLAGFNTRCFDGQYFFDTDHPVKQPGGGVASVSNFQGGSGSPWFLMDTTRALKPLIYQKRKDYKFVPKQDETDDNVFDRAEYVYGVDGRGNVGYGLWQLAYASKEALSLDSFEDARASHQSLRGDNGKSLRIKSKLLVVGPQDEAKALRIANAEQIEGSTNIFKGTVQVLVVPELSN